MLDYLTPEARRIDPVCEHLLNMCRLAIVSAERRKASHARRQRLLLRSREEGATGNDAPLRARGGSMAPLSSTAAPHRS
jgi:hypothetical protein